MKRILVVDDNHDILDALDLLLSLHDYQVVTASTVKDAVIAATNRQIDLIIQDMNFSQGTTSGAEGKSLYYQFLLSIVQDNVLHLKQEKLVPKIHLHLKRFHEYPNLIA